jgi:hypothetical protein
MSFFGRGLKLQEAPGPDSALTCARDQHGLRVGNLVAPDSAGIGTDYPGPR